MSPRFLEPLCLNLGVRVDPEELSNAMPPERPLCLSKCSIKSIILRLHDHNRNEGNERCGSGYVMNKAVMGEVTML